MIEIFNVISYTVLPEFVDRTSVTWDDIDRTDNHAYILSGGDEIALRLHLYDSTIPPVDFYGNVYLPQDCLHTH